MNKEDAVFSCVLVCWLLIIFIPHWYNRLIITGIWLVLAFIMDIERKRNKK